MVSQAKKDMVLKWHADGYSAKMTAKYLNLPIQAVQDIIDGHDQPDSSTHGPEFIEPRLFDDEDRQ